VHHGVVLKKHKIAQLVAALVQVMVWMINSLPVLVVGEDSIKVAEEEGGMVNFSNNYGRYRSMRNEKL